MRFRLKLIPLYIFIAINVFVIVAMNFCAHSAYLHPTYHPTISYFGLAFPAFLVMNLCFVIFWALVKRRCVLIPLIGMCLCPVSIRTYFPINYRPAPPDGAIKFLSYNVMNFGGKPMADLDYESNPISEYILNSGADIVCIQEGIVTGLKNFKDALSETYPYIQEGAEDGCHYNVCISKFPIVDSQEVHYESKTNKSYAYKILIGEDTVLVVNNHFESYHLHDEDRANYKDIIRHPKNDSTVIKYDSLVHKLELRNSVRGLQADRVAEYMDSVPCKYKIACGDFNDPSLSYTHHRMTRTLNDAFTRSGMGPGTSYNQSGMYFRIDNILVSPSIATYRTKVDNSISESDHYPILSYLILKEK